MKTNPQCKQILADLRARRREAGTGPYPLAVRYSKGPIHLYRAYFANGRIAVAVRDFARRTDPQFLAGVADTLNEPQQEVDAMFLPGWLPAAHPQYTYTRWAFGLFGLAHTILAFEWAWHYMPGNGLVYHWSIGSSVLFAVGASLLIASQWVRRFD